MERVNNPGMLLHSALSAASKNEPEKAIQQPSPASEDMAVMMVTNDLYAMRDTAMLRGKPLEQNQDYIRSVMQGSTTNMAFCSHAASHDEHPEGVQSSGHSHVQYLDWRGSINVLHNERRW